IRPLATRREPSRQPLTGFPQSRQEPLSLESGGVRIATTCMTTRRRETASAVLTAVPWVGTWVPLDRVERLAENASRCRSDRRWEVVSSATAVAGGAVVI